MNIHWDCTDLAEIYKKLGRYNTVKLGYNELGYNEQNELKWLVSVILRVHFLGYNEQNSVITNKIGPNWPKSDILAHIF